MVAGLQLPLHHTSLSLCHFPSCKGHSHLHPPPPSPISSSILIIKSSSLFLLPSCPDLPSLLETAMTLSPLLSILSLSGCCSSSACLQNARPCQDSPAPLRTNLTSRLPIQEGFPGTNPTPTLQHPTKPQGLKCQEGQGPQGHGIGQTYFQAQTLHSFCPGVPVLLDHAVYSQVPKTGTVPLPCSPPAHVVFRDRHA